MNSSSPTSTGPARQSGTFTLGGDLPVTRLGYGAMQITGPGIWGDPADPDECVAVLRRAVELGVDFIDTADAYGPAVSEELIRKALHPYNGVTIATKGGLTRTGPGVWKPVGLPEYLTQAAELSLRRLGVEAIDLYQLHRIDPRVPLADQLGALKDLQTEGKIRHIGLSEVSVAEIEAATRDRGRRLRPEPLQPDQPAVRSRPGLQRARGPRLHPLVPHRHRAAGPPWWAAGRDGRPDRTLGGPAGPGVAVAATHTRKKRGRGGRQKDTAPPRLGRGVCDGLVPLRAHPAPRALGGSWTRSCTCTCTPSTRCSTAPPGWSDLFTEAARQEMPALAMTDHGNVFGAYDFWKQATAAGVKPIIGMEGYYVPIGSRFDRQPFEFGGAAGDTPGEDAGLAKGKQAYTHMTLLAETTAGMHNLFRLSSLASLEGFYYKPRFDRELLATYAKGSSGPPAARPAR